MKKSWVGSSKNFLRSRYANSADTAKIVQGRKSGGKVHGQRKEKHKEHVDVSPAPLPNHADGGCQDGACDEADSSAEEIAPDGIGCDNHSRGAEGGGKTHGPFVHAYRDLRNNQN